MKVLFRVITLCLGLILAGQPTHAQVLLIIDVSDVTNITFTATSAFPLIADNSFSGEDGFTLIGLLATSTDSQAYLDPSSDLKATGISPYDEIKGVDFSSTNPLDFEPGLDLFMYRFEESNAQEFSLSQVAFTGSALVDLFGNNIVLKSSGGGDIYLGGAPAKKGAKIGEYQVIPEPGTFTLFGLGLLGIAWFRLRHLRSRRV